MWVFGTLMKSHQSPFFIAGCSCHPPWGESSPTIWSCLIFLGHSKNPMQKIIVPPSTCHLRQRFLVAELVGKGEFMTWGLHAASEVGLARRNPQIMGKPQFFCGNWWNLWESPNVWTILRGKKNELPSMVIGVPIIFWKKKNKQNLGIPPFSDAPAWVVEVMILHHDSYQNLIGLMCWPHGIADLNSNRWVPHHRYVFRHQFTPVLPKKAHVQEILAVPWKII